MITNALKDNILNFILNSSIRATIIVEGIEKEIVILKKVKEENKIKIIVSLGSDIKGNITKINIYDSNNIIILEDTRRLNKNTNDTITTILNLYGLEVV